MASVHFARLLGPSGFARTVAVKRPHPHLVKDPEFAMMFIDEARLAARIRHPNVVSTLDVIQTDEDLVLVMDYVHGEALSKLWAAAKLGEQRIPVSIAASILIDALHGLHAAHEATDDNGQPLGIVHRDVSPQNILVGLDGITRIVDFGIAKAAGRAQTTRDGAIKGKYAYMAPEQVRGERVSRLTDVFAASIVLWELLTGERLFLGKNEAETMHKCLVSRIRPPSMFVPDLPPKFDEILRRGLSREPTQRYATAREMALDIESCVAAIRPSEIGAWVEKAVGESLSARAAILAGIERSAPSQEMELAPTVAATPSQRPSAIPPSRNLPPVPGGAGMRAEIGDKILKETEPTVTGSVSVSWARGAAMRQAGFAQHAETSQPGAVVASATPPVPTASTRKNRRAAWVASLLVGLVVAASGAMLFGRHPLPDVTAAASADAPPLSASVPLTEPAVRPGPVETVLPKMTVTPASQPIATAHVIAAPASPPSRGSKESATPKGSSPSRPSRGTPRNAPGCDPPYTIDAMGRQIFKIECM